MLVPFLAELVDLVHRAGALAGWQVGSAEAARDAGDAGCDLIVVRGVEGGGRMYGDRSLCQIERDHLISHLLVGLREEAGSDVVFFGGTALQRAPRVPKAHVETDSC